MDVRQLRYFVEIVEQGSLSRAARRLNLVQPALGLQVRNLERELGTKLLVRHSRGSEPTEAGLLLVEYARRILAELDQTRRAVQDLSGPPRGTVSLGISTSLSLRIVVPIVRRCRSELPLLRLSLVEGLSNVLTTRIGEGTLDMALTYASPSDAGLAGESLARESLYLVEPRRPEENQETVVTFAELARTPLILPGPTNVLRRLIEDVATGSGERLDVVAEVHSPLSMRSLAEAGIGATILPFSMVADDVPDRLSARRIVSPELTRTLSLFRPRKRPRTRGCERVRSIVQSTVALLLEAGTGPAEGAEAIATNG